jgi:hypothetical protein
VHTVASFAHLVLTGGPFDGETAALLLPDLTAPAQIVWSGWMPWGFDAWLYEWHGERTLDQGRTDTLVYRLTGRRLAADEIPYAIGEAAETWADAADLLISLIGPA